MKGKKVSRIQAICVVFALFIITAIAYADDMNFAGKKEYRTSENKSSESTHLSKMRERTKEARREIEGALFYIQTNMWFEKENNFAATNFHKGRIIPVGTKVRVDKIRSSQITFTILDENMSYTYTRLGRHSKIDIFELFSRYFSKDNPMVENGKFSKFTKEEQRNIQEGIITPGMTKDAVLMAYGYPPTHKTPELSSNVWIYWESRAISVKVYFKDGVAESIDK